MGQHAPNVIVESSVIKRFVDLICHLPGNARVAVTCRDNKRYSGIVCIRPSMQAFRDKSGKEGMNAVLRLEDASAPGGEHRIWLDQIERVERLDGISGLFAS